MPRDFRANFLVGTNITSAKQNLQKNSKLVIDWEGPIVSFERLYFSTKVLVFWVLYELSKKIMWSISEEKSLMLEIVTCRKSLSV